VRWLCNLLLVLLLASPALALEEWESVKLQDGAVADGNGTEFRVTRHATVAVDLAVSGTATVTWEVRSDPSGTYQALRCQNSTSGTIATTATATGNYVCPVPAQGNFRARISSCSSCAVTAIGKMSTAAFGPLVAGGGGGSGDASLAEQQTQTTHLAAIETAVEGTIDVNIVSGAGSGGTAQADDADFTAGTTQGTPAMGVYESTPSSVTDGDLGIVGITQGRRLKTSATIDAALPAGANNIGTVTITDGAGAVNVIVDSSALPSGASTSANQTTIIGHVDGVEGLLTTIDADTGNIATSTSTTATNTGNTASGVGATGDAAATAGSTGSLSAKLRLVTSQLDSILTELGQKTEPANTQIVGDGSGPLTVDGTVTVTDGSGALNVIVDSSALPSGAATSANQSTIITAVQAIQTAVELIDNDQTGASVHYRTSAGSTEDEHEVKGSAGRLFSITATNTNAAVRYLRCANQVIGSTTPGTTTVFLGLAIPGATTGAGFTTNFGPAGIAFSTGLTCWLVTGAADSDVAEVAANEIKVIYSYK
jgi:hypothetical protein